MTNTAVLTAPRERPSGLAAGIFLAVAWLVPGLGHLLIGDFRRGAALLLLVGGTYGAGLYFSKFEVLSQELHPYAWYAVVGVGATLPLSRYPPVDIEVLSPDASVSDYKESVVEHSDLGVLFCAIAGLLNLLVLLDLFERTLGGPWARGARK